MQVDDAPDDEEIRETYNFAPGYYGVVYRADTPDRGYDDQHDGEEDRAMEEEGDHQDHHQEDHDQKIKYKLQKMRWGLIPFWTKRQPDYGSMMRTINCRDDSLLENRGMWTSMKRKKRCVVVCQGFYEWLKKGPGGKEKIPHFIKRKDGDLMCFAGLWDCVSYEGALLLLGKYLTLRMTYLTDIVGSDEKLYTYTIITTSSNPYLKFLHDRMPVILEPGSQAMKTWLDPHRTTWSSDLQSILKPYEGELECYPVAKEVGKVGNNSPDFLIPIDSKENKGNIANFFANAAAKNEKKEKESKGIHAKADLRETKDDESTEDNAPKPVPLVEEEEEETKTTTISSPRGIKRSEPRSPEKDTNTTTPSKKIKTESPSSLSKKDKLPPVTPTPTPPTKKLRSATKNDTTPVKKKKIVAPPDGSQPITNFFKK
jgi:putative SOS response-associated peptidase YedK